MRVILVILVVSVFSWVTVEVLLELACWGETRKHKHNKYELQFFPFIIYSLLKCHVEQYNKPAKRADWSVTLRSKGHSRTAKCQLGVFYFPSLSFHGASLWHFHLFWERRSVIRSATETTQVYWHADTNIFISPNCARQSVSPIRSGPTPLGNPYFPIRQG